jgi:hypothetical protein
MSERRMADIKDANGRLVHVKIDNGNRVYTKTSGGGWTSVPGARTTDAGAAGDFARSHHGSPPRRR